MLLTRFPASSDWWRQACVYQIYPRSFADANGDGIGDLKGITSRVPYLQRLGFDAVWLSPFYPSALKDGGYDVADYRNVDPKIGTLADFDDMITAFKAAGIKVIVDIVPNHSSDDHPWFQEAIRSSRGSPARDRYIFRDGLGANMDQPPSDWESLFGGSAWEPVGDGQYYLHLFDTSQPDLNWEHPDVRDDFVKTLRFWGDRGVSGFRVDAAHGLVKDLSQPFKTQKDMHALFLQMVEKGVSSSLHPLWDRDEVHDIYKEWRKVLDEYDPPLAAVAEARASSERKLLYASPEGLGQTFSDDILACNFSRDDFKATIDQSVRDATNSGTSTTWVFSSHDVVRHATRYGLPNATRIGTQGVDFAALTKGYLSSRGKEPKCDFELGLRRARAATLLLLALPGSAYLYQGEELGLPEVPDLADDQRQDPTFFRTKGEEVGRDGCRVPIPWTSSGHNFGFGDGKQAHLPMPEWMGKFAVAAEDSDPNSTLNMYRRALALRRELQTEESMVWVTDHPQTLHFRRKGGWEVLMNFDGENVDVPKGQVLVCSGAVEGGTVPKNTTIWLRS
ncbi:hypothetical protein JCM24511_05334 [Saitozyma sp. JCM 24511]|nr:hypothetical protein JCM24511_05334 [Saitozyma sp. JCM 24511]